jgi:hypothetical protein
MSATAAQRLTGESHLCTPVCLGVWRELARTSLGAASLPLHGEAYWRARGHVIRPDELGSVPVAPLLDRQGAS